MRPVPARLSRTDDRAQERLRDGRMNLEHGAYAIAVGAAYHAMLYGRVPR